MKLKQNSTFLETDNISEVKAFSIVNSPKAFKILSDSLYSKKIEAIIRELSCNAYDAHKSIGKEDVPFEITLPSYTLDPDSTKFIIKDFGTGLAHEQVLSLYTTYFESTKTGSNDFIGALGLGSKSPFCYTSQFIVESRVDGIKRTYCTYLNNDGLPAIALTMTDKTKELNGLTIHFDVRQEDSAEFQKVCKKAFMFFSTKPIIHNFLTEMRDYKDFKIQHETENFILYERDYHSNGLGGHPCYCLQGQVLYPIDLTQISKHIEPLYVNILSAGNCGTLIFKFNIGDLDVQASREHLSYDKNTIKNISDKITDFFQYMTKSVSDTLNSLPTYYKACKLYTDTDRFIQDCLKAVKKNFFNGKELTSHDISLRDFASLEELKDKHFNVYRFFLNDNGKYYKSGRDPKDYLEIEFNKKTESYIIICDEKKSNITNVVAHVNSNYDKNIAFLYYNLADIAIDKREKLIKDFVEGLCPGFNNYILTSSLPKYEKTNNYESYSNSIKLLNIDSLENRMPLNKRVLKDRMPNLDDDSEEYYYLLEDYNDHDVNIKKLFLIYNGIYTTKVFKNTYVITKKLYDDVIKNKANWKSIHDHITTTLNNKVDLKKKIVYWLSICDHRTKLEKITYVLDNKCVFNNRKVNLLMFYLKKYGTNVKPDDAHDKLEFLGKYLKVEKNTRLESQLLYILKEYPMLLLLFNKNYYSYNDDTDKKYFTNTVQEYIITQEKLIKERETKHDK